MKKNNLKRALLILIDIIAVFIIIFTYLNWKNSRNFVFKKYTYSNISKNVRLEEYNNDEENRMFKITGDSWYATIEILLDRNQYITRYPDVYKVFVLEALDYTVPNTYKKNISNHDVVIFELTDKSNNNTVLADYKIDNDFTYEIEVFNNNKSFDISALDAIIAILDKGVYDSESTEKYTYDYPLKFWLPPETE